VFLQITAEDLAIPGQASFGIVKAAQARGDFDVLADAGVAPCVCISRAMSPRASRRWLTPLHAPRRRPDDRD
jgi:hypothetical protein